MSVKGGIWMKIRPLKFKRGAQESQWISTNLAMERIREKGFGCTRPSLLTWAVKYNLGKKVGGRWYIESSLLDRFLAGLDREK
jgi:hypothetical protein